MYRENVEEVFETCGDAPIIIVCNKGYGLRNFKILTINENMVKVRYSITEVKTPVIKLYHKNMKTSDIAQSYYILDVKKRKIVRVPIVSVYSNFPKKRGYASFPANHNKAAITFCVQDDIEIKIESNGKYKKVVAYSEENGKEVQPICFNWIEISDLPKTAFLLDFKENKVQKVQQMIFLI